MFGKWLSYEFWNSMPVSSIFLGEATYSGISSQSNKQLVQPQRLQGAQSGVEHRVYSDRDGEDDLSMAHRGSMSKRDLYLNLLSIPYWEHIYSVVKSTNQKSNHTKSWSWLSWQPKELQGFWARVWHLFSFHLGLLKMGFPPARVTKPLRFVSPVLNTLFLFLFYGPVWNAAIDGIHLKLQSAFEGTLCYYDYHFETKRAFRGEVAPDGRQV